MQLAIFTFLSLFLVASATQDVTSKATTSTYSPVLNTSIPNNSSSRGMFFQKQAVGNDVSNPTFARNATLITNIAKFTSSSFRKSKDSNLNSSAVPTTSTGSESTTHVAATNVIRSLSTLNARKQLMKANTDDVPPYKTSSLPTRAISKVAKLAEEGDFSNKSAGAVTQRPASHQLVSTTSTPSNVSTTSGSLNSYRKNTETVALVALFVSYFMFADTL